MNTPDTILMTTVDKWLILTKKCKKCNKVKLVTEFYKRSEYKDGYYNTCKECFKEHYREHYQNNRKYYIKRDAKRRGLGYFLLFENFLPPEISINEHHCNYFVMVPIPEKIHLKFGSNQYRTLKEHRALCNAWLKKYYMIDIEALFNDG